VCVCVCVCVCACMYVCVCVWHNQRSTRGARSAGAACAWRLALRGWRARRPGTAPTLWPLIGAQHYACSGHAQQADTHACSGHAQQADTHAHACSPPPPPPPPPHTHTHTRTHAQALWASAQGAAGRAAHLDLADGAVEERALPEAVHDRHRL